MKKYLTCTILLIYLSSCKESINSVNEFYKYKKESNYEGMASTLHSEFLQKNPKEDCIAFFKQQDSINGILQNYRIIHNEYKLVNSTKHLIITVECIYPNDTFTDVVKLMKENNDYKIYKYEYEYNINIK